MVQGLHSFLQLKPCRVARMLLLMCDNHGGIAGSREGPPGQNRRCSGIRVQHLSVIHSSVSAMAENIRGAERKPKGSVVSA